MRLAASICPLLGSAIYLARRLEIVAISGRVLIASQLIDPIRNCMSLVYLYVSLLSYFSLGKVSTGYPGRCGVDTVFTFGPDISV